MTDVLDIEINLQEKQEELRVLLQTQGVVNIGYGGPRGGGKSRGLRDVMLSRRLDYPNSVGWIVRRTFDELYDNHISKYFQERPFMREWYSAENKQFNLPNGSVIRMRYAEYENDLLKEYGKEAMDIFIDQSEQFSENELNFLRTCRRFPGVPDGLCKLVCSINPGGKSHAYNRRVFMDRHYVDNEIPESFAFIRAAGWDNIEWVREALIHDNLTAKDFYSWDEEIRFQYFITRSQYGRDLNALPDKDRQAQLFGRWDYFEGQVFPELSAAHDLDRYFDTRDPVQWRDFTQGLRIIGSLDHASTGVTTYGPTGIDVDENQFQLDEYYQRNRLISEHAEAIQALERHYHAPDYRIIDPSTESKTLQDSTDDRGPRKLYSVQDAYRRCGLHFVSAHRKSIAVGIDLLKQLLKVDPLHRHPFTQESGSPAMFISRSRCPNLWREMTELQIIDGTYVGDDHAIDRIRYVAMSRPERAVKPQPDIRRLPTLEQMALRSYGQWTKKFDKLAVKSTTGSYW